MIEKKDLEEAIYQALGEASMAWSEIPEGVFDSENAVQIGEDLAHKIEEMSAMGAGAVSGAPMKREDFLQELKLREFIRKQIKEQNQQKLQENIVKLKTENKLRSFIRSVIKESEEDRPHHSTGINVLSDLLKKIVPVLEIDYKKMTSKPEQRQSFRAHVLKAAQNVMETEKVDDKAGESDDPNAGGNQPMMHEDGGEAEINLDVTPQVPVDPEAEKFIDVERPSQKKAKSAKPDPVKEFGIEGEDETGRNIAMTAFQKVERGIIDSYSILSDPEDKRLFYDYLITNLKLYFDKFEDELKAKVDEPESNGYDQGNGTDQQGAGSDQGLGL